MLFEADRIKLERKAAAEMQARRDAVYARRLAGTNLAKYQALKAAQAKKGSK